MITGAQLKKVVTTLKKDRADKLADMIAYQAPKYGIDTPNILHEFLANVAHESGGFRLKDENMNYTAKRLIQIWPTRFRTLAHAKAYEHNPQTLANLVYGKRMGNVLTNDGWIFRGAGFIQVTGRYVYERYQRYTGFDTPENVADAMRTDDYYALDSALWLFAIEKNLIEAARNNDFIKVVKRINGGTIGLIDRKEYYERAKLYVK